MSHPLVLILGASGCATRRDRLRERTILAKMARFDPEKRWLAAVDLTAEMKRQGWRPVLLARGGLEGHRHDVFRAAWTHRLRVTERVWNRPGASGLAEALRDLGDADLVDLRAHVDPEARRALFRAAHAVLANSGHEPFGLVGLEAMAAGGVACTGCSGEEYAVPGHNALVIETGDPREFIGLFAQLLREPKRERELRRAGVSTARRYAWPSVLRRVMLPRVELSHGLALPERSRRLPARASAPGRARALEPDDSSGSELGSGFQAALSAAPGPTQAPS